jgi:hypothetical protein
MPDDLDMNITRHLPTSLILGSVLVASVSPVWAGAQGVGSVELIPFPEGSTSLVNAYFSGDGELRMLHDLGQLDSLIFQYVHGEWILLRRELRAVIPGLTPYDVSADGGLVLLSDFSRVDVVDGSMVVTMPREWTYNVLLNGRVYELTAHGYVWGGSLSGDGQVATMSGRENGRNKNDSLAWFGGDELVNLSADLPREDSTYGAGLPNSDGTVIVFGGTDSISDPQYRADVIWRWSGGQLVEVPRPYLFDEEERSINDISADGETIFGTVIGPARGGVSHEPLAEVTHWARPFWGQEVAWMWTESGGTMPIIDEARFLETRMISADADGSIALILARSRGSRYPEQYLWLGGSNFIKLDELFHSLNISIDADFYGFNEISDDGTKLMGLASVDGQTYSHAIIVTIPDLTP